MGLEQPDSTSRRYRISHTTRYTYEGGEVTGCYERGLLCPRATPHQAVISNEVRVDPPADLVTEHIDHFGNHSHYLELRTPHRALLVSKESVVDVHWPGFDPAALDAWTVAEAADLMRQQADPVERAEFLLPSPLVETGRDVADYARGILVPDRPLGQAVMALVHAIHDDFTYSKGATSVRTTLQEVLSARMGVCQDFAHLAVGCLRAVGLPARYVSGYIETKAPANGTNLRGSDASHAWAAVLVPDGTWVDLDPTNNHLGDARYITTGWGRDFGDVSPLKGVIFTESTTSHLEVSVHVERIADGLPL
jgi:transglutaminase-like putative cysteine protease